MADARARAIRDAILTRVQGINGAAGGYNYTVALAAAAVVKMPDKVGSFPAAFVHEATSERRLANMGDSSKAYLCRRRFGVICYLKGTTAQADVINWVFDVVRAVEASPLNLGLSYVTNLWSDGDEEVTTERELAEPYGMARAYFMVEYLTARGQI